MQLLILFVRLENCLFIYGDILIQCLCLQEISQEEEIEPSIREGPGKVLFFTGNQYDGEFHHGLRHGTGAFQFKTGARYEGEWKKGMKHGSGKFCYPDGSWYFGGWKHNKKHGFGKYVYENGDCYDGSWKEDVKHGVGTYTYREAEVVFRATWNEGSLKGPIEINYANFLYNGYWNKDGPKGEGVFSFRMKYMLPGHVESFVKFSGEESASLETLFNKKISKIQTNPQEGKNNGPTNDGVCVPRFIAHEIQPYEYKILVQPIPLPRADSVKSFCTQSSKSGLSLEFSTDCKEN